MNRNPRRVSFDSLSPMMKRSWHQRLADVASRLCRRSDRGIGILSRSILHRALVTLTALLSAVGFLARAETITWDGPSSIYFGNITVTRTTQADRFTVAGNLSSANGPLNFQVIISPAPDKGDAFYTPYNAGDTKTAQPAGPDGYFVIFYSKAGGDFLASVLIPATIQPESFSVAEYLKMNLSRMAGKMGGSVQMATGAETTSRLLFSFKGARNWDFKVNYNSIAAGAQATLNAFGFGWTHDYESKVEVSNGNLILHWDASRANTFAPVSGQSGVYTSSEDGARYDTITAQPGGGWLLVHKDQSSLLYDAGGNLVEDRDPNGRKLVLSYASGRVAQIADPISGTSLAFTYDSSGTLSALTDATGATVSLVCTDNLVQNGTNSRRVLSSITNQNGKSVTFGYLPGSSVLETLTDNNGLQLTFNGFNDSVTYPIGSQITPKGTYNFTYSRLGQGDILTVSTTAIDRNGHRSSYIYDHNYNLNQYIDADQRVTGYNYDSNNQVTSVIEQNSRTTSYTYDANGNLLTVTDPAGKVTTFTYDARNNLLTTTDPLNQVTTRTYDSSNNLLTLTDALGRTTTWTYDGNSLPLTMILPGGGVTHYTYTAGRLTQVTDPNGVVTTFGYDADGRVLYQQDALGKRVTYTYDGVGNVLTVTNALNQTLTYTYDYRNRVASITDPMSATTSYTYDTDNNRLTSTDALGKVTTYTYDNEHQLQSVTDPLSRITNYNYSFAGRLLSVVDPAQETTSYEYDTFGQLSAVQDALGHRFTTSYEIRGLPVSVTDPLNRTTSYTYDDAGRRLTSTDPLARQTAFAYDALNRLQQVTDPGSLVASQGFDADGNRTSLTNPLANATSFTYDAGLRLTGTTTPEGHATTLAYDARGLPLTITQHSGHATTFAYDDAAHLSSTTDPVGTVALTRDADGRVLTVTENGKTLTRVYDTLGRLTSFTDGDGNVIGYLYDDIGRLTQVTYPDGKHVNYAYDAASRLSTVTDWAGRVTTYTYDAIGRVTQVLRPNGTKQTKTYDAGGQLTALRELAPDGTTVLYSGDYGYDLAGQLTSEALNPVNLPGLTGAIETFDRDNRLLTHNGAAATFDADGNLLSLASGLTPSAYTYDARNRLTGAGGITYSYDAENRRVALTGSTGTTHYAINPNAPLDQVLVRTAPDGTKTYYVYGLGLLHEETGGVARYYHCDRRGDTVMLTDASGNVTDRASYGVYGDVLSRTGTTNTPFLFNGCYGVQTDANGLYYLRARYYHPALRRFLNQDSVLGLIASPASLNRFAYANGNPVTSIDPFGSMAVDLDPNNDPNSVGPVSAFLSPGVVAPAPVNNPASGTTITVNGYGTLTVGNYQSYTSGPQDGAPNGVTNAKLSMNFTPTNGTAATNYVWVQWVTNDPLNASKGSPYLDSYTPSGTYNDNFPSGKYNNGTPIYSGGNLNFYDHPQNPTGNPVNFSTFLIDKNTGTILQQVNWGLPPNG